MVTTATADNALKSYYLGVVSDQLNFAVNPLLARIRQTTSDVWGKDVRKLVRVGVNGGVGAGTEDGALLVGDAMFRLISAGPAILYADRRQMEDSVAKIWALHPTALYFGHGRPAQGL